MRIAMGVEYDGRAYCGWQHQDHSPSVQEQVQKALSVVADETVRVHAAGRTDTGVHALGQVLHFDTQAQRRDRSWVFGGNANLPADIVFTWARPVDDDFHARFRAVARRYRYVILNRPVRPSVLAWRVAWDYRPLDLAAMQAGARHLLGEHDFSAYRAVACQARSPVREVQELTVSARNDLLLIDIQANGFLHHMVRNIAGVLMTIGAGERHPDWSREVLAGRDRALGGVTAPACGLYFMDALYPRQFAIPGLGSTQMVW